MPKINTKDGNVILPPFNAVRKFSIAHELGHLLADAYASAVGGDCDLSDSECPADNHSMGSKEYQTCAFTEGIAHFFSAATWNDFNSSDERDCVFRYWSESTVDCEGSLTSVWPEAYMEANCSTSSNSDRGVELDWFRMFWDVKTDGSIPNFEDMMDWVYLGYAYPFPPSWGDPYDKLGIAADTLGGTIETNWDGAKVTNGIDW